jgi:hypothetical protein
MNFIIYDIGLLIAFAIFVSIFLYTRKKNLKKEGLLLLYKATWGIKFIERISKKYKRLWNILGYVAIIVGYFLMATMIYFFIKIIWVYLFNPEIVRAIKIPPLMPLIPYLPSMFKLDFLPPFYFIYWIVIIAIIAIPHELAHGIYSAYNKIKIKNTGFGFFPFFLPIFLAAFVEPDEDAMKKKSKFAQMSILASGTFANVLTAIFFFAVLWLFFSLAFSPSGVVFDTYSYSLIGTSAITMINNIPYNNATYNETLNLLDDGLNEVSAGEKQYFISKTIFEDSGSVRAFEEGKVVAYNDAPAIKNQMVGAITKIDGVDIISKDVLLEELNKKEPGQSVSVQTFTGEEYKEYELVLGEDNNNPERAILGIGFIDKKTTSIMGRMVNTLTMFKEPNIYYSSSEFGEFIYNLLWWIVLISISVALINMLPIGIFDGGRFFFLTIAAITGSEKIAKKAFIGLTFLFLILLALIMFFWAFSFL